MHLTIAAVGKLKAGPDRELYQRYARRVTPAAKALGLGPLNCLEISESRKGSAKERRADEARTLLAKLPDAVVLIAMDETGESITSERFARLLCKQRDAGVSALALVIGGPDGLGPPMRCMAARSLAMVSCRSPMDART